MQTKQSIALFQRCFVQHKNLNDKITYNIFKCYRIGEDIALTYQ